MTHLTPRGTIFQLTSIWKSVIEFCESVLSMKTNLGVDCTLVGPEKSARNNNINYYYDACH